MSYIFLGIWMLGSIIWCCFFYLKYKHEKFIKEIHWELIQGYKKENDLGREALKWWKQYAEYLESKNKSL